VKDRSSPDSPVKNLESFEKSAVLKILKEDIKNVSRSISEKHEKLDIVEVDRRTIMERVEVIKCELDRQHIELLFMIESHHNQLKEELKVFEDQLLMKLSSQNEEVEWMEIFNAYCQEVIEKAPACYISHSANELHERAAALISISKIVPDFSAIDISFIPADVSTGHVENWIGQLSFKGLIFSVFFTNTINGAISA